MRRHDTLQSLGEETLAYRFFRTIQKAINKICLVMKVYEQSLIISDAKSKTPAINWLVQKRGTRFGPATLCLATSESTFPRESAVLSNYDRLLSVSQAP